MKLVEIASQLNCSAATIRTWKNRYKWDSKESEESKEDNEYKKFFHCEEIERQNCTNGVINDIVNCLRSVIVSQNVDLSTKEKACEMLVRISCEKGVRKKICDTVRRADLKNDVSITMEQWNKCIDFFRDDSGKSCCAYCGIQTEQLEKDHVIPFAKGGRATVNNILPACKRCNTAKNNKNIYNWYTRSNVFSENRMKKIVEYLKEVGGDRNE